MRRRWWHSVLISLNLHVWAVVALSVMWVAEPPDDASKPIEFQLVQLPASIQGATPVVPPVMIEVPPEAKPPPPLAHQPAKSVREPIVEYSFKVSEEGPLPQPDHGTALVSVASPVEFVEKWSPARSPATTPTEARQVSFDHMQPGGDTRPLIQIIQARIDAVTPLIHRTSEECRFESGIVRVKFLVNQSGYPYGYRILSSSGSDCLTQEVDHVLHMAEPYPYLAGWIPVTLKFTL